MKDVQRNNFIILENKINNKKLKIENFYPRFKSKLVKFCNLEIVSPNFTTPSPTIALELRMIMFPYIFIFIT
jgi:hypothetical protein